MSRRVLLLTLAIITCNAAAFAQTCPSSVSWCSGTYAYDGMGNIRAIGADTYVYDTAGRLVSGTADVQRSGVQSRQDYSYDAFGNRTAASRITGSVDCLGGCEISAAVDQNTTNNHITASGAQYDDAGNLKFIQGANNATYTYTYDTAGSLVRAVAGTDDRQFLYTADDERIATANGATWTWTVRGLDGKVLREFSSYQPPGGLPTSNWKWTKDYVWRDGLLLASVTPTTSGGTSTQHFHLDHLGTPRLVTGDNGVRLGVHAYYPFGAELNLTQTEQPAELMKFTGHERDLLANDPHTLDYMHARYEMGTMGRFLSIDPKLHTKAALSQPQIWNRYAYAMDNPLKFTDPKGEDVFLVGDNVEKRRTLMLLRFMLHDREAAKSLTMDKFGRLVVTGMSAADWGKKFGGDSAKLGALIDGQYKLGVGLVSADVNGDARFDPVSRHYGLILIDERRFPQERFGTMQWLDTTMAHELYGHGAAAADTLKADVGHIHPGKSLMYGIGLNESDGMWAENQYRSKAGLPLRQYYAVEGDYIPPGDH